MINALTIAITILQIILSGCYQDMSWVNEKSVAFGDEIIEASSLAEETDYRIIPQNERSNDKTLDEFIEHLEKIVAENDLDGFLNLLCDSVILSESDYRVGKADFVEMWASSEERIQKFWKHISSAIRLGGVFSDSEAIVFVIPYTLQALFDYIKHPHLKNLDCYFTAVAVHSDVAVFARPDFNSPIIGHLNYEVVEIDVENYIFKSENNIFWHFVRTIDKTIEGYVLAEHLSSCTDYMLMIRKDTNHNWRIFYFVRFD